MSYHYAGGISERYFCLILYLLYKVNAGDYEGQSHVPYCGRSWMILEIRLKNETPCVQWYWKDISGGFMTFLYL